MADKHQLKAEKSRREEVNATRVLDQLNTFTLGPPLTSTGLTGDQTPDSVIEVADFNRVNNQVNIQEGNTLAMETLNTIGQATNMQSQSGPIPGTGVIKYVQVTQAEPSATLFRPDPGEVWRFIDWSGSTANVGGATINVYVLLHDEINDYTMYANYLQTSTTTPKDAQPNTSIYIDHNLYIKVNAGITGIAGAYMNWYGAFIRVR